MNIPMCEALAIFGIGHAGRVLDRERFEVVVVVGLRRIHVRASNHERERRTQ